MSTNKQVKGAVILSAVAFTKRLDPNAWDTVHASLSQELRSALPGVKAGSWYPVEYFAELLRGLYQLHKNPEEGGRAIRECGRFIGGDAAGTFLRLLIKILTPAIFASKFPDFWNKYHNFGNSHADLTHIAENRFVLFAEGYDHVHHIGAGWIDYVFDAFGKKVSVTTNAKVGDVSVPTVRWEVNWTA